MTTIIKFEGYVINLSNQIAIQIDLRNPIFSDNGGVIFAPIDVTFDGSNHLGFDLTHEREEKGLGRVLSPPLLYNTRFWGSCPFVCRLLNRPLAAPILNNKNT